jgi:hypothetical protein
MYPLKNQRAACPRQGVFCCLVRGFFAESWSPAFNPPAAMPPVTWSMIWR